MTKEERESIIEQLSLVTGYSTEFYKKLTDEQLQRELEAIYD